ncbi:MAG: ABC transporter permease [Candidatus Heimdallarchaeota archaeon]|nr:ABC transporter permease [Candidatus Heimdallarchaeota archaeon]
MTYTDITKQHEKQKRFRKSNKKINNFFQKIKIALILVFWVKTGLKSVSMRFKIWFKGNLEKVYRLYLYLFNDSIFLIVIRILTVLLWLSTAAMLLLDTITISLPIYIESLGTDTVLVKSLLWAIFDLMAVASLLFVIWAIFKEEERSRLTTIAIIQIFFILAGLLLGLPTSEESVYVGLALLFSFLTIVFSYFSFVNIDDQKKSFTQFRKSSRVFFSNRMGKIGLFILVILVTLAALGPSITRYEADDKDLANIHEGPSSLHILGTDKFGHDTWTVLLDSLGISLLVGVVAGSLCVLLGTTIGVASAYIGGWVDTILMRFADIVLVMPPLPLMFLLASLPFLLGTIHWSMIAIIYVVVFWPVSAKLIRGQALSLKQRTFVHSAIASGAGNRYVIFSHLLPNVFPLMLTMIITSMRQAILYEAFLAYLGLGDPLNNSLGLMLQAAQNQFALASGYWWLIFPPAIAIALTTLSFAFIGMAFDEIVNPRLRKR